MSEWWIMILGMVAGLLTTGSFVPQVVKAWREGDTNAISLRMYLVMTAAFALWLGYGLIIGSWPIIVFNVCNLVLSAVILWLKLREGKRTRLAAEVLIRCLNGVITRHNGWLVLGRRRGPFRAGAAAGPGSRASGS
jgi:MtN3 and saliva related transmembrane protein